MREYTVLEIKCEKNRKIADIFAEIKSRITYNHNFFALQNLKFDRFSKSAQILYDELNLGRFSYKKVLDHLYARPDYDPARDDRKMISNIDDRWNWGNASMHESLSAKDFDALVDFCDKLKAMDVSTLILGLDEIEWDGNKVSRGTYGFEKADCTYDLGRNYLSNSVIIGRTYENKNYTVYISCETRFRDLALVQELANALGAVKSEVNYFAPEDDAEREEWNKAAAEAEIKFNNAISGLEKLKLQGFEKLGTAGTSKKIDVKKYIKTYLCTDGWKKRKARPDEWPTVVSKDKGNATITIGIIPRDNGHQVQTLVYYRSKMFKYAEHISYISDAHEDQIERFFQDTKTIRDYLYEVL